MRDQHQHRLDRAIYLARTKSSMKSFQTGAVLASKNAGVVSEGWSHFSRLKLTRYRSIHAELHTLLRAGRGTAWKRDIYIATIRGKSGNVGLGKPCDYCMELLADVGVRRAFFTVEGSQYDVIDIA